MLKRFLLRRGFMENTRLIAKGSIYCQLFGEHGWNFNMVFYALQRSVRR